MYQSLQNYLHIKKKSWEKFLCSLTFTTMHVIIGGSSLPHFFQMRFFESFSKNEILSTYSSLWSLWCIHKVTQGITLRACAKTTSNLIFFAEIYPKSKRGIKCVHSPYGLIQKFDQECIWRKRESPPIF